MLRGVHEPKHLMAVLGIESRKRMDALIGAVQARWVVTGSEITPTRRRGEALRRLDMVETDLWSKWSEADGHEAATAFMRQIVETAMLRNEILGLTPKVAERLALMPETGPDDAARVAQQPAVAREARRIAAEIAARRRAGELPASSFVDHEERTRIARAAAASDAFEDAEA